MPRIALGLILSLCGTALAFAQEPTAKLPVIGWITPSTTGSYQQSAPGSPGPQLLRESLARHGLIDGKTIRLDMRLAEGRLDRLPGLAEALVREGAYRDPRIRRRGRAGGTSRDQNDTYRLCG
jgi:hypothetical protein